MLSILVFSIIALFLAVILAVIAEKKQTVAWIILFSSVLVAAFIAFDKLQDGIIANIIGISYFYIISMVMIFIILFAIAYVMKENGKSFGVFISIMAVIALVVSCLVGCSLFDHPQAEVEEIVVEEEYASEAERLASSISENELYVTFGNPRVFKPTSLNAHRSARVKKTKLNDAITYQNGDTETQMIEEILSNPIYLQSLNYILQDCGIVGKSNWAKAFTQSDDYVNWIDGSYVTDEYHIIACRYLIVFKCSQFVEKSKKWTPKVHYGLDEYSERVVKLQSDSKLTAYWQVYKFANWQSAYSEGADTFIGFSCNDGRFAIMKKKPAQAKKASPKADVDAAAAKTDIDAYSANIDAFTTNIDASNPEYFWTNWDMFPVVPEIDYAPGELELHTNRIPDNQGNAPVGGFGSGVDNLTAGVLQPTEPTHVYNDSIPGNNTIITHQSSNTGGSSSRIDHVDEHRPSSAPIQRSNTTTYSTAGTTTSSRNTGNTSIDSVNDGVVDGF